jgi:hypothetical protein
VITETVTADAGDKRAVVFAGDYLNKLTGEQIERECRRRLDEGCTELVSKLFSDRDRQQHRRLDPARRY